MSLSLAALFMASATAVLAAAPPGGLGVLGWALLAATCAAVVAVVVAGVTGHLRTAWSLTLGVALLDAAVFVAHGGSLMV